MQQIYGGVNKIIVDSKSGGNLMYLPLDKVMQAAGAPAASAPAAQAAPAASAAAPATQLPADARTRDNARSRERDTR
jgi:membrane protease subunit HflK